MSSGGFSEREIDPEVRRRRVSELTRCRDELADRIERHGTAMPAEEHFRAYDELEDVLRELRKLELNDQREEEP